MKRQVSFCGHILEEGEVQNEIDNLSQRMYDAYATIETLGSQVHCYIVMGDFQSLAPLLATQSELLDTIEVYRNKREEFYTLLDLIYRRSTSTVSWETWV